MPRPEVMRALLLSAVALLCSVLGTAARAQVSLTLGDTTLSPGDSGSITAAIATDGSAVALQFDVLYDPAVLTLGTVSGGAALTGDHSIASSPISPGRDRIVVTTAPVTALGAGVLATINLAVLASAGAGTTPLTFGGVVISDASALPITPSSLVPGSVTVLAGGPPPPPPSGGSGSPPPVAIPALPLWGLGALIALVLSAAGLAGRRTLKAVLPLAVALLVLTPEVPRAQTLPGDANGDGVIDAEDVRLIVERILERGVLPGDGDCNRDSTINVLDTVCSQIPFVPGATAPIILGPGDRSIVAEVAFEMNLFAADPDAGATLSWELLGGPAGLAVSADGVLTWTPGTGAAGPNPVSVRVTDDTARSAEASFSINVTVLPPAPLANAAPRLTVPDDLVLPVGTPLAAASSATDPDPGDTLTYALIDGPAGMTIDAGTGGLSWTPGADQAGRADVVIQVTDAAGASDFGSFIVEATPLNAAPVAVDDVYIARKGETLIIPALEGVIQNDTDPNDDALSATRLSDPTLGSIDSFGADGSFSYTPGEPAGIMIGMEVECAATDAAVDLSGAIAAGDVDNDGNVELAALRRKNTTETDVMIIDPVDCSFTLAPVLGMGIPFFHGLTTLIDLDDDPELELVRLYQAFQPDIVAAEGGTGEAQRLMAVNIDGSPLDAWVDNHGVGGLSAEPSSFEDLFPFDASANSPVAADLDGDGEVELLVGFNSATDFSDGLPSKVALAAWEGRSGNIRWEFIGDQVRGSNRGIWPVLVDLDLDGDTEIVFNHHVLDHEGNLLFNLPHDPVSGVLFDTLTSAIANFDNDAFPEIIAYDEDAITLYSHEGDIQWRVERRLWNFGFPHSGITIAELDGDPLPEFAFTANAGTGNSAVSLFAFDDNGDVLWGQADRGFAAAGNASPVSTPVAFDFDGDGIDELVQQKGNHTDPFFSDGRPFEPLQPGGLYIFDGATGDTIDFRAFEGSLEAQHPLTVGDVDGDGSVEIIAMPVAGLGTSLVQKIGHIAGNPWPGARATRFQTAMQPTYRNADGSLPDTIKPHWLQPGRNAWNRVLPDRDPFEPETDSFTYRVSDGALDSSEATVNIEVRPAGNPPFFLSEPLAGISRGIAYEYTPLIVDVDPGDEVTLSLASAPAGMTLDPATGTLSWYPEAAGDYPVSILATDTLGLSSAQIFRIAVGDPVVVPDVVGSTEAAAESTLTGSSLAKGSVFIASSVAVPAGQVLEQSPPAGSVADFGARVALTLSAGPAPLDRDDDGDGFSESAGDCNDDDDSIFPGAPDANDDGIDQDCDGLDGNKTLVAIEISPGSKRVLTGEPTPLIATGIFDDGTAQNLTAVASWTNGPTFSSGSAGSFEARAEFRGITGTADFTVLDRVAEDLAPIARIDSPAGGDVVTAPTDIEGLVSDTNLLRWELAYRYAGEDAYVVFEEGIGNAGGAPPIGELDPTTLLNGLYDIRLRAYDRAGNVSEDSTTVQVEGQMKVGNFTLRYVDLELPLNGIPITLARTYDSRDKRVGDFGVGWRLAFNSIEIRTSRELGSGWRVIREGLSFGLLAEDLHVAAVRLPGGRVEAFEMVVSPNVSPIVPFPPFSQSVSFRPLPGTLGRLEALGENNISILDAQPGPVTLRLDSTGDIYNPTLFRYTTPDGTMIDLDTLDGIKRAETPGGQVLTITPTSIMHSNGTVVDIERDEAGRITQITDPGGFTQDYRYDANGNLRSHSDQEEFVTRFRYDAKHNVIEIIDPLNRPALRNDYDESGRLVRAINADGDSVSYVHDVAGRQEQITDADGFVTVVEFDDYGNAIKITDPLGGVTSNVYDADGNLTATTNAVGETTLLSYDTRGNLVTQTNAIGATVEFVYDGGDRLILERDALGRETSFEYDASGRLASITGAAGIIARRINYDANGNVLSARDANGRTTSYAYNDAGFRTEIVDPRGNSTQFTVNANGRLRSLTDPRGGVSTATLDRRGLLVSAEAPLGNEMSLVFNGARDFIGMSDSDARSLARTVSIGGRVTRFEDPSGNTTQMQFDGRGHRIQLTDASGRVSRFDFDALGRQIRVHYPSGAVAAASYDLVGRIVTETDPNGNVTSYEYDSAGRNTAVTDALGQRTEFTYDLVGNLTARLDARGNMTRYIYDVLDRLIETEYADGSTETIDYDPVGNVIAEIDRLGRTKSYTYDPNDNLLSVTDIDGGVTTYAYDANDNRTSQTDPNGHTTRMVYDANDRLIEKQYPDGSAERYEYDAGNRVARTILPDGKYIDATYDGFGRPTGYDLNGEATESFTYDGAGRPVSSTNLWGTVDYSYDLDGRVAEIRSEGGHRVTYTYDDLGNRTSISTQLAGQAARTTTYTYDALNRLATIVEPDGDTTTYSYDPVGNVASITYPNGVISSFTYDDVNQLTRIEHRQGATTLAAYDYTLDAGGRRLRVDHVSGDSVSFSYDSADRLLQETHRNASGVVIFEQTFTYDDVGNRLTQQITGQARTVLAYDSADKLLIAGSTTFAYDANGRLISKTAPLGTVSYVYDVEGQLLRVTTSTGTVTYAYDAMGKRRVRIDNGSEQNFLLDEASLTGFDQTLVAFDDSDNQLVEYHWGDRLISADDGRSDRFFHADASSNIRLLTDELGTASDTIDYDAFGNVRDRTGPADSPYGFAGEWQEEAEGLVFLRARFYDPETGRFISRDPFAGNPGDPVSLHRYLYANANPVMNTDPSGQLTLVEVNIAGAISAGIAAIYYGITANGASFWELAPKVAIAYVFGAAGAVLGAGAAVAVEAGAALAFARVVVGEAVRKWSLVIANALAQGLVAAIAGVQQLKLTLRYEKGASYTDEMGTREAMKLFAITFVMEFITMGHYNPSLGAYKDVKKPTYKPASAAEKTAEATRAVSAGTRSGDKKLFELWQASGEDIIPFITRVAKEGEKGPARSAARSLTSRLNKMGGEAEDILKNVFSGKVELGRRLAPRIFRTEAQAASFIDSVKLIASPIVDEALK